mmetsp:Transcript_41338/g.54341  ORF Transcript_41338/g.54341 Transcript_41338/m.54341 type:complete len:394 (+) Transcript_41338:317-1498(+)|eukprot:CAMPEP_0117744530 /NCGR_PEP_ID=MMETSP0947-20121206/6814_1 /TAXON_ID=44440 /ORGANISM="Chattonella subsalsa, Strain CCMP2191" /LENGTH=393 /DNA_ID=CAMNT_0005561497 /DNA_START=307 /DNA_END=1488 /DNA_ORIENTATION=-
MDQTQSTTSPGSLIITVMEARDLVSKRNTRIDPYAALTLGPQTLRSRVATDTQNPSWMDTLIFQGRLSEIYHSELRLAVYDKLNNAQPIGVVHIALKKLSIGKEVMCWFDLSPSDPHEAIPSAENPETLLETAGTVYLSLTLNGPMRQEVKTACTMFDTVTSLIDKGLGFLYDTGVSTRPYVLNRYSLMAALPFSILAAIALPGVLAVVTVGMPVLFPFFLLFFLFAMAVGLLSGGVALLSRPGRTRVAAHVEPVVSQLKNTTVGQQLLYETGPRPSPDALVEAIVPTDVWYKLGASLLIDFIGSSSYALPMLGEGTDVLWAPVQAMLLHKMYSRSSPWASYVGFAEELLPFTDACPTATLAWFHENAPGLYQAMQERRQNPAESEREETKAD